jgi:hypothetical protein
VTDVAEADAGEVAVGQECGVRVWAGGAVYAGEVVGVGAINKVKLVWTTADEDVEAEGWDDLAGKLKAPAAKKEGSDTMHQMRAFNRLGADGWEVYENVDTKQFTRMQTWSLRRRLP